MLVEKIDYLESLIEKKEAEIFRLSLENQILKEELEQFKTPIHCVKKPFTLEHFQQGYTD